ncbi:MAG: hypothetical protein IJK91_02770 [Bacteroidales bacterium]|nr:hypothetical protein [Bacteroidales bacterium]
MKKLFVLMIAAAMAFTACEKKPQPTPTPGPGPDDEPDPEPTYVQPITIDGDFADWAKLPAANVASAKSDAASPWDAINEIRVYADDFFIFYYLEYNNSKIADLLAAASGEKTNSEGVVEKIGLPIRLNINTDGEFESGYKSYSLDGYDFIIEGSLAEDGAWKSFDGTLHQRIGSWTALQEGGLCTGAGNGNKYEICLPRDIFNAAAAKSEVVMLMGDEFQTGVRFYTPDWGELGNMPDGAVTDDNTKGWGHLLTIQTVHVE